MGEGSVCPLKLLWLSSDPIEVVVVVVDVVVVLEIEKKVSMKERRCAVSVKCTCREMVRFTNQCVCVCDM